MDSLASQWFQDDISTASASQSFQVTLLYIKHAMVVSEPHHLQSLLTQKFIVVDINGKELVIAGHGLTESLGSWTGRYTYSLVPRLLLCRSLTYQGKSGDEVRTRIPTRSQTTVLGCSLGTRLANLVLRRPSGGETKQSTWVAGTGKRWMGCRRHGY